MKASIIIPTAGTKIDYLLGTLRSIEKQEFPKNEYEILVVDNNPHNVISREIEEFNRGSNGSVRYIREARQGATEARHAGAQAALGEILVYTDDDVIVSKNWLSSLLEPFEDPQVGCAGGKTIPRWDVPVPEWFSELKHMAFGMLDLGDTRLELKGCQIWSNNLAVRKSVLYEVGGYNPDIYGAGTNGRIWYTGDGECGLEEKILKHGYKLIYEPKAWIYHRVSAARTTKEYFYKRSFVSAIGSSYAQIRKMKNERFFALKLPARAGYYFLKSGIFYMKSLIILSGRLKAMTRACHYYAKANHQLRAAFSKKLRGHIFQESYLKESEIKGFAAVSSFKYQDKNDE